MPAYRQNFSTLSRLAEVTDKLLKGAAIAQYGAICFTREASANDVVRLLLITSRDTGRWVIPKGWGMPKKKPHQVAQREAWEEAGIKGKARKKPSGYYKYVKSSGNGELVPALVQVHLLEVSGHL